MHWNILFAVVMVALGVWQLYYTKKQLRFLQTEGDENTSPFSMMSLWSSLVFSVFLIVTAGIIAFMRF